MILKSAIINTKLGKIVTIADENYIYLLEFTDLHNLESEIEILKFHTKSKITTGRNDIIDLLENKIRQYFNGKLDKFTVQLKLIGTEFQQRVWNELLQIPKGITVSYIDIAIKIGKPKSFRAVANANASNKIAIIIPCHRVINANGNLGGYASGIKRKQWLINHESNLI
jgi:AraC family transcriptional regulator of adaptative response/methylated-DNA-[protein]-cysteine methyltransferase